MISILCSSLFYKETSFKNTSRASLALNPAHSSLNFVVDKKLHFDLAKIYWNEEDKPRSQKKDHEKMAQTTTCQHMQRQAVWKRNAKTDQDGLKQIKQLSQAHPNSICFICWYCEIPYSKQHDTLQNRKNFFCHQTKSFLNETIISRSSGRKEYDYEWIIEYSP